MKKEIFKIKKEDIKKRKARISYLQIIILLLSSFAFSYLVSAAEPEDSIDEFQGFIAQNSSKLGFYCCPEIKNENLVCQEILPNSCSSSCNGACIPTKCEKVSECKKGCCYDEALGGCDIAVPKKLCEDNNGKWLEDSQCNIKECKKACCILGSQTKFTTEKECEILSEKSGIDMEYKTNIKSEIECIELNNLQAEGACMIGEKCSFMTKGECISKSGSALKFYEGNLCSNPELDTKCEKQHHTGCIEGKNEVYWFDSCGNRENIYDSDKEESWNNGKVLGEEKSCNPDSGNSNSESCGNCNVYYGTFCGSGKAEYGNYVCNDMNCKQAPDNAGGKKDRRHGESWCVYESYIGEGKDVVGSRHYRYYCYDGKVNSEPCGDFRTGICVQSEETREDGNKINIAACRPNQAMLCTTYNNKEKYPGTKGIEECQKNSDCEIRNINFGKKYVFDLCTPKYPPGFDLIKNGEMAGQICNQADFQCKKIEVKDWGGWECKSGCECDKPTFTQQMNDWCGSLGDCGGKVNVLGKTSDSGYSVTNAPGLDLSMYEKYAKAVAGQFALPGNFTEKLKSAYGWGAAEGSEGVELADYSQELMYSTIGAGGLGGILSIKLGGVSATPGVAAIPATPIFGPVLAAFGSLLATAAIGAGVGLLIASILGMKGEGSLYMAISGGLFAIGFLIALKTLTIAQTLAPLFLVAQAPISSVVFVVNAIAGFLSIVGIGIMVLTAIFMGVTAALGIGKVRKKTITFNCEPWQAPRGGSDCGKCTGLFDQELQACARYKCQSLGQTCELFNQGTGNELCVDSNPKDANPPVIKPWKELISKGFKYEERENGFSVLTENGECIPEFTPMIFGISTNEPSQCWYNLAPTSDTNEMADYFGASSLYDYNHTMILNMPSMESIVNSFFDEIGEETLSEEEKIQFAKLRAELSNQLGDLNFYLRCSDKKGNVNIAEYLIKTCIKQGADIQNPVITKTEPANGAYIPFNKSEIDFKIWVNEPSECRYDYNEGKYESMTSEFECKKDFDEIGLFGFECNTTLTNLIPGENNIYVKCKDQPWLKGTINESQRNLGEETIKLVSTPHELKITEIKAIGNIISNGIIWAVTEPANVNIKAGTEGGSENGKAECSYSFDKNQFVQFAETYSDIHKQEFNQMLKGNYTLFMKCFDIVGNNAEGNISFAVEIDKTPPIITRFYYENGLKVITNENAKCKYSFNSATAFENATSTTDEGKKHFAEWKKETYYIQCIDEFNNKGDKIKIKAYEQIT